MPIYPDNFNVVIPKNIITTKYEGGIDAFERDWNFKDSKVHQEDNELYCLSSMNIQEGFLNILVSKGLEYDMDKNSSEDFVVVQKYGGFLWSVNWLETDNGFSWHIQCPEETKEKAKGVGRMTMDVIAEFWDDGINVFDPIL